MVREVGLDVDHQVLGGRLAIPAGATGLVLFAHGSGSSRHSPRNQQVAAALEGRGLATLLFDLLSERESDRRDLVFDVALLARRLARATAWAQEHPETAHLHVGYFGASTGAAAALWAAATDRSVGAVVSRGGRPDLARERLHAIAAPTLLIVGSADDWVLARNREAAQLLTCPHEVAVVVGAKHLFEEPGALDEVATLAGDWFVEHL